MREILKAAGAREPGRIYTTHYQEGGMRCKLYGYSMPSLPRGFKAKLARAGYKNISIISGAGSLTYRHPCVTILASLGDQYVSPRSPVMRAKKGRAAQQLAKQPPKPKKPDPVVMVTVPLKPTAAMCRAALIPEAEARRYYARMIAEFLKEPTDE